MLTEPRDGHIAAAMLAFHERLTSPDPKNWPCGFRGYGFTDMLMCPASDINLARAFVGEYGKHHIFLL